MPLKHWLTFKRFQDLCIPEGRTHQNHCCDNLKSYIIIIFTLFNDYMPTESYCNLFTALYSTTGDDCKYLSKIRGKEVVDCCPTFQNARV
jgi:hypothetical protein